MGVWAPPLQIQLAASDSGESFVFTFKGRFLKEKAIKDYQMLTSGNLNLRHAN